MAIVSTSEKPAKKVLTDLLVFIAMVVIFAMFVGWAVRVGVRQALADSFESCSVVDRGGI